jgi:hypothetical protein
VGTFQWDEGSLFNRPGGVSYAKHVLPSSGQPNSAGCCVSLDYSLGFPPVTLHREEVSEEAERRNTNGSVSHEIEAISHPLSSESMAKPAHRICSAGSVQLLCRGCENF